MQQEQQTFCFFCQSIHAASVKQVCVTIAEANVTHHDEQVFVMHISLGGDRKMCEDIRDVVHSYVANVLKIPM